MRHPRSVVSRCAASRIGTGILFLLAALICACGSNSPITTTTEPVEQQAQAVADTSTPVATWYMSANGWRLEMVITSSGGGFTGNIRDEGGAWQSLSSITWNSTSRWLEFRRNGSGFFQWYRLSMAQGVLSGRFSHSSSSAKPGLTSYTGSVTGWSPTWLDTSDVPRTWNVAVNTNFRGVLRIDRNSFGVLQGRFKIYDDATQEWAQEELEADLTNINWNGTTSLSFTRNGPGFSQVYSGTVNGRSISGTFTHNGASAGTWSGTRAEVLGFGLGSRLAQRTTWQELTRDRLVNLTEGMRIINSSIPPITVTEEPCVGCPFLAGFSGTRDDNPNFFGPAYTLKRLRFSVNPGNRFDPSRPPPPRVFYGYLARPTSPPPAGGYRAMVAVNGHSGDARQVMTTNSSQWYGESAARRNLVVLSLDIGHRNPPSWDQQPPITHPAIIGSGYSDSDWEEDGERAFSVRRAIDYLQTVPNVRADRIFMSGLSMGGEVTAITAALDPRIKMAIVAGYSPDMYVMDNWGNEPCYGWFRAGTSIHEYIDVSDYLALIAPRLLLVETGAQDGVFSPLRFPADKQVVRRARGAYGWDVDKIIHFLHDGFHEYRVGDIHWQDPSFPRGVRATSVTEPILAGDQTWQTNGSTFERSPTLYHLMNESLL